MSCNLCHELTGHKERCPMLIRVEWDTETPNDSVWEKLTRTLLDQWAEAREETMTDLHAENHRALVRRLRQKLDDGDPMTVLDVINQEGA